MVAENTGESQHAIHYSTTTKKPENENGLQTLLIASSIPFAVFLYLLRLSISSLFDQVGYVCISGDVSPSSVTIWPVLQYDPCRNVDFHYTTGFGYFLYLLSGSASLFFNHLVSNRIK
ncbi:hypothetical protein JR782_005005 [Salmonella enterica subsp. enterica serovar Eastbourne]|nr:hypothetical protein [Salmonella enterica subsp. enterica serovar Eastbourne]EHC5908333.1 hypothetical protein [Salmonella enterica subsp. enterica serovar Eastbourne]EJW4861181.1 hypothetical protein [Salmonella enterica]